jgi:hypothetical protein
VASLTHFWYPTRHCGRQLSGSALTGEAVKGTIAAIIITRVAARRDSFLFIDDSPYKVNVPFKT